MISLLLKRKRHLRARVQPVGLFQRAKTKSATIDRFCCLHITYFLFECAQKTHAWASVEDDSAEGEGKSSNASAQSRKRGPKVEDLEKDLENESLVNLLQFRLLLIRIDF